MASEARRAAKGLVERRVERFESRHSLAESQARLQTMLGRARATGKVRFTPRWIEEGPRAALEAEFAPPPGMQRFLQVLSIAMTLLLAASVWAIASSEPGEAKRYLVPIVTAFAVLALPLFAVGLGSQREAEEARIRKAIRVALMDEDEGFPPRQRWADED